MADSSPSPGQAPLLSATASLFLNPNYSDITVQVEGESWPAHKSVICPRSSFFDRACNGDFKQRLTRAKEAKSGVLVLPDDKKAVVKEMLRYIYTTEYSDEHGKCGPLLFNVMIHTIGDKYDIKDLCEFAEDKYEMHAWEKWNTKDFAKSVAEMYATAPDSKKALQETAAKVAIKHAKELLQDEKNLFYKTTEQTAAFATRVARELVKTRNLREGENRYRCPSCLKRMVLGAPITHSPNPSYNGHYYFACPYCQDSNSTTQWELVEDD